METLFPIKYLPKDESDLARYILLTYPFARDNVKEFEYRWLEFLLDREMTREEKSRLHKFSLISGNRRRQEIQLQDAALRPSSAEQRRRLYMQRGEHLVKT